MHIQSTTSINFTQLSDLSKGNDVDEMELFFVFDNEIELTFDLPFPVSRIHDTDFQLVTPSSHQEPANKD